MNYSECEETFKIYSNDIFLNSVAPKCGSVRGGAELSLDIDIDQETAKTLFHLKIGFQPAKRKGAPQGSKKELMQSSITKNQSVDETQNEEDKEGKQRTLNASQHSSIKGSMANISAPQEETPVNPLDINEAQLESENWVCSAGYFKNNKII